MVSRSQSAVWPPSGVSGDAAELQRNGGEGSGGRRHHLGGLVWTSRWGSGFPGRSRGWLVSRGDGVAGHALSGAGRQGLLAKRLTLRTPDAALPFVSGGENGHLTHQAVVALWRRLPIRVCQTAAGRNQRILGGWGPSLVYWVEDVDFPMSDGVGRAGLRSRLSEPAGVAFHEPVQRLGGPRNCRVQNKA